MDGLRAQNSIAADTTLIVSLGEAIHRAQQNEPAFAAAVADRKSAGVDQYLAKAALLPTALYHNQILYTQPNGQTNQGGQAGTQPSPIFIANNAVHEYASQASINETIGLKQFAAIHTADANAARSAAELEIARRGLLAAVVSLYYGLANANRKLSLLEEALKESQDFADQTQKRESAREVALADVLKAQLQQQLRQRDLMDATVATAKAKLELGVLLFSDPRTSYETMAPNAPKAIPTRAEMIAAAGASSPEIKSALASMRVADADVLTAKAAYLPDLGLNFTYGIDAPQFARRGDAGVNNLGYSMSATLDIPVWDWFSTQKRVKQSEIRRTVARVTLSAAQRRFVATLEEAYAEAATAHDQLDLLDLNVRTATESLRLTRLRYTAGEATALEVVDAQTTLLTAQTSQADGLSRYESALANLQLLTGTL
ncbi:TolC family protein [Terriglobus saanensis]|nr:TolC family protein [Terriglobus saanensis]